MEGDRSSDFLAQQKWKEADSSLLTNYLPPPPGTHTTIVLNSLFGDKEIRILMVGLTGAGKTTILDKICNVGIGGIVTTTPTLGFNVETLEYKNTSFTVLDLEGDDDKVRASWRQYYYRNIQGVIFVLDCSDHNRVDEARDELHRILNEDELKDAVLLVYGNKSDAMGAMRNLEICSKLDRFNLRSRPRRIRNITAISGREIYSGIDWLVRNIVYKAETGGTDIWGAI